MTIPSLIGLLLASFGAGAINSVAGGGTLLSFPTLVALGLPPVVANATNTVAMVPGSLAAAWAYRSELRKNHRVFFRFLLPSALGGLLGAAFVLGAKPRVFELVVPWLVLGATLLILFKKRISQKLTGGGKRAEPHRYVASIAILLMAVYGGYFGAGIGIITLAVLSMVTPMHIHEMNGVKTLIASTVNGTAAVLFLAKREANVTIALIMMAGMILGGYFGAKVARKTQPKYVERLVVCVGFAMTLLLVARWFR
jgi:uncharacterized membrane protein YfcA